jgi:hypothetical protein
MHTAVPAPSTAGVDDVVVVNGPNALPLLLLLLVLLLSRGPISYLRPYSHYLGGVNNCCCLCFASSLFFSLELLPSSFPLLLFLFFFLLSDSAWFLGFLELELQLPQSLHQQACRLVDLLPSLPFSLPPSFYLSRRLAIGTNAATGGAAALARQVNL